MKIRIVGQQGEPILTFSSESPWFEFFDVFTKEGYEILNYPFGQKIDALICNGYSKKAILEAKKSNLPKNKMCLILWEPPINNSKLHSASYLENFGYIYTPSKIWASNHNVIYFNWPVAKKNTQQTNEEFLKRERKSVLIQSNKISLIDGENYSLRRNLLFESLKTSNPIILYGPGWGKLPALDLIKAVTLAVLNLKIKLRCNKLKHLFNYYPFYKGIIEDKNSALKNYMISIVIENHNSYISEKIFDSLNSGCITLYIGPNLMEYGLSSKIAIQLKPNIESILEMLGKLHRMSNSKLLEIQQLQQRQFKQEFNEWNNHVVLQSLGKQIHFGITHEH
jgi:hypothetical protein